MRQRLLLLLFPFLLLSPTLAQLDYTGRYSVEISGDDSWHRNVMTIRKFSSPLQMDFVLDLNLGPESRGPMPHERLHFLSPEVEQENENLSFEIDLDVVKYAFQLYPVEFKGKPALAGIVTITEGESERTTGVLAVKTSAVR